MSLHRKKLRLLVWVMVVLVVAPGYAQNLRDMQIFAPAEMDQFGGGPRANEGAFVQFDGLYWWISAPEVREIGSPGMQRIAYLTPSRIIEQSNTRTTGDFGANPVSGQRWDFGYVHEHDGIMFSFFKLHNQTQRLGYGSSDVLFDDRPVGPLSEGRVVGYVAEFDGSVYLIDPTPRPLPMKFDDLLIKNTVKTWGIEADYMYRGHAGPRAGIFELLMGARYLQFDERFSAQGSGQTTFGSTAEGGGEPLGPNAVLADSDWFASANNHIIGPQIGLRWFRQTERWTWSSELRFTAGLNNQNLTQSGTLGSQLGNALFSPPVEEETPGFELFTPLYMTETSFNHNATKYTWSPIVELRLDLKYQLTHAMSLRVGWSGLWVDGIARASSIVDYTFYETQFMGIDTRDNRQSVFMQGVNFGVDINR